MQTPVFKQAPTEYIRVKCVSDSPTLDPQNLGQWSWWCNRTIQELTVKKINKKTQIC